MEYKLQMNPDEVYERAVSMVRYAKKYCSDIEFSCEDGTRSDPEFLAKIFEGVIKAKATPKKPHSSLKTTKAKSIYFSGKKRK